MELQEAIRSRRSIRQFLSKPVDEDLIQELIAESLWAPSWGNTQCWEIVAVTGQKLAEFKKKSQEQWVPDLCRQIQQTHMAAKVMVASFDSNKLVEFRKHCPEVATSAGTAEAIYFYQYSCFHHK